jgi:AcrR family transcriptional regulator
VRVQEHCTDRLLDAGRELFARNGYDGTSVRAIASKAKANLGAITYHFGSKHVLYYAVLSLLMKPLGKRIHFSLLSERPPLDKVESVVRVFFDHIRSNPDMPAIIIREMASGRPVPKLVSETMGEVLRQLSSVIKEGQASGTIRAGDPLLLALSCVAQPIYLNLARRAIAAAAGLDQGDAGVFHRVVEHAAETVRASLRAS